MSRSASAAVTPLRSRPSRTTTPARTRTNSFPNFGTVPPNAANNAAVAAPPKSCAAPLLPPADPQRTKRVENVTVGVRVRAFLPEEKPDLAIRMRDNTCEVRAPNKGKFPFTFDKCFWSNNIADDGIAFSSQKDVFESIGRPLVDNAFAGYNSAVIAYGPTGSGKTYSIFGPPNSVGTAEEGLTPRVCNEVFQRCRSPSPGSKHHVSVSIFEVYLEEVFDLLSNRRRLKIRSDGSTFSVCGLKHIEVNTYDDVVHQLEIADHLKTFAVTAIHDRSSRAHTIFQLQIRTLFDSAPARCSHMLIADLAGSERIKEAKTDQGLGLEQACNINLSLLSLGTCIEAVVNRCKNGQPCNNIGEFRNSSLTKILKDYIGGNSLTAMLVTIAPSAPDANNSLAALRFADRAKQMQSHAIVKHGRYS